MRHKVLCVLRETAPTELGLSWGFVQYFYCFIIEHVVLAQAFLFASIDVSQVLMNERGGPRLSSCLGTLGGPNIYKDAKLLMSAFLKFDR